MRNTSSSDFDERNLREYYGVPFEHAIRVSKAQGIMEAYNKINGEPSATSSLLKSLVMGEWGFDGALSTDAWVPNTLVSDQHAYPDLPRRSRRSSRRARRWCCKDQAGFRDNVKNAYTTGKMTVEEMDAALRGNLRVRFRVGDLDPPDRVPGKKILGTRRLDAGAGVPEGAGRHAQDGRAAEEREQQAAAREGRADDRRRRRPARQQHRARLVRRQPALQDHDRRRHPREAGRQRTPR
jgi:beta-glucosidase-like glycosyl hydrolase